MSALAAFTILAHYLTTVTAAPVPFGFSDIVDGIGDLFDGDLIESLLGDDQDTVASKAVSSAISGSEFFALFYIYTSVCVTNRLTQRQLLVRTFSQIFSTSPSFREQHIAIPRIHPAREFLARRVFAQLFRRIM